MNGFHQKNERLRAQGGKDADQLTPSVQPQTAATTDRVQDFLLEIAPSNAATIETIADRLAMRKSTLQCRLEDHMRGIRDGDA